MVENCEIYIPHLYLAPPQGQLRQNFVKMFDADKTRMIGLPYSKKNYDNTLNRFHPIPESYGQTDGRMDGQNCYINIARQYADARYKPTGCRLLPAVAARPYRHHQMM